MFKNNIKKGFTLIELLVVVLIIGILSAIALPQYVRAVEKSRYAEAEELLQSLYSAQQRYYLINNKYAENFGVLDIDIPNVSGENEAGQVLTTKNFEFSLADVNGINNLAKAKRIKGTNTYKYGMYKNMNTGALMCEDFDTNDKVKCYDLGLNSEVYTCPGGSISYNGQEDCPSPLTCWDDSISYSGISGCPACPSNCSCNMVFNGKQIKGPCWDFNLYY